MARKHERALSDSRERWRKNDVAEYMNFRRVVEYNKKKKNKQFSLLFQYMTKFSGNFRKLKKNKKGKWEKKIYLQKIYIQTVIITILLLLFITFIVIYYYRALYCSLSFIYVRERSFIFSNCENFKKQYNFEQTISNLKTRSTCFWQVDYGGLYTPRYERHYPADKKYSGLALLSGKAQGFKAKGQK